LKSKILLLVLVLAGIACYQSSPPPLALPTVMPTEEIQSRGLPTVTPAATPHPTRTPPPCLIVTAEKALNLRYEPSPDTAILAWLYNGEQITGLAYGGGWWEIITQDGRHGFVKADYVTRCP